MGYIGWLEDISERKDTEAARKRLEEQLHQSQRMDAIGQLAGGIAHDFNNLLVGIMGNAELLALSLPQSGTDADLAKQIHLASTRASDLTRQLLAFSRKGKMHTTNVDLHQVIAEVGTLLERSIDKSIQIVQKLEASRFVVSGDSSQLQSAILNLAVNGRDAMPAGGQLTLSTRNITHDATRDPADARGLPSGEYVEIGVTDTGIGMDTDIQEHLFEPFFTTKEKGKGTGLGLASVYGCVKDHRGTIHAYSELGKGSTLKILLPLSGEKADDTGVSPRQPVYGHGHVLIIDDEETVRSVAAAALTRLGYDVSCCAGGQEGIDFFTEHHATIDLVILDLIMPKIGGADVFRQIKHIDPDVRVLISSGFTRTGEADALIDDGALGFLHKPFRIHELAHKVDRHIRG